MFNACCVVTGGNVAVLQPELKNVSSDVVTGKFVVELFVGCCVDVVCTSVVYNVVLLDVKYCNNGDSVVELFVRLKIVVCDVITGVTVLIFALIVVFVYVYVYVVDVELQLTLIVVCCVVISGGVVELSVTLYVEQFCVEVGDGSVDVCTVFIGVLETSVKLTVVGCCVVFGDIVVF